MASLATEFNSNRRSRLFLEMASAPDGATAADVYRRASELGDTVTQEAYYNLARRLVHRGLLKPEPADGTTRYRVGADSDAQWLEEEDLVAMIDPEYPLLALPIWSESRRQIDEIPEEIWAELRERLKGEHAPALFVAAIHSYSEDFHAQIDDLARATTVTPDLPRLKQEADGGRRLLERLLKFGLGISEEAVHVPMSVDVAIEERRNGRFKDGYVVDARLLADELNRRVAPEPFVVDRVPPLPERPLIIGAVDGSTKGGMLKFLGDSGDLSVGHAPMISINTAVGQINRSIVTDGRTVPVFMRLPERPEDMQRHDNRYSIMAKLFFPDLSESEYMHSVWNAMDLMEARAAQRLLGRWYGAEGRLEIQAADVVLRDGTVSPQDRDFHHYRGISSYERIVRDAIETNWRIASKCREDRQSVVGVVKAAQLNVFAPIINWYAARLARDRVGQIAAWPVHAMNLIPDQAILTRLLTAKRKKDAAWNRTCVTLRPFHALTNFAKSYSRVNPPSEQIRQQHREAIKNPAPLSPEERIFWENFRPDGDPYLKMLDGVFYANMFVGAVPRLDLDNSLPRIEFIVPADTAEDADAPWLFADDHRERVLAALQESKFQVAAEHEMFRDAPKLDVLPTMIIRVHDTVKIWATELLSRVQEYLSSYLAQYVKSKQVRRIKVRPFTRTELQMLYQQMKQERDLRGGGSSAQQLPE
jgi:hypothetical protein